MTSSPIGGVSRRSALKALGLGAGAFGLSALVTPSGLAVGNPLDPAGGPADGPLTVASWRARGAGPVYIAHRGSGDVYPEHSMEAYRAAVDWGASCMEISVAMTSDGVLICMHDSTYDRTTTGEGVILDQPSTVLDTIRIWQPRLGEAWTRNPPRVPLFEDVLRNFGGSVVLCVEAKVGAAYEPMMALVEKYGLRDSVIVKGHFGSSRLLQAQAAGYPVFSYFGAPAEITLDAIKELGGRLRPESDVMVLAGLASKDSPYASDELITAAVATGIPVWVHPLHRRSHAAHFFALGVQGAICSSYGYIAGVTTPVAQDSWAAQAISPGEVSRSAGSASYAPSFTADGQLVLAAKGVQHFITMGQFCPVPAAATSYVIDLDVAWQALPAWTGDNLTVAFGHADDRYYEHRQGSGTGYHVILRANGDFGLYLHRDGTSAGEKLAPSVSTPPMRAGEWAHLRIAVTPNQITASRTDTGDSITAADSTVRGGYLHVGRSSPNGIAAFRTLVIS